jgi:hypothetical protein
MSSTCRYVDNLRQFGFDHAYFAGGGSDRLVDTLVAWGSDDAVRARIQEHLDAGANQGALHVLSASDQPRLPRVEWRHAAEVLPLSSPTARARSCRVMCIGPRTEPERTSPLADRRRCWVR